MRSMNLRRNCLECSQSFSKPSFFRKRKLLTNPASMLALTMRPIDSTRMASLMVTSNRTNRREA